MLPEARSRALDLIRDLKQIASTAGKFADDMDFRFLLDPRRKLLSLGFDVETGKLASACYDLLASEARIAVFAAIAKEDIPQDVWFQLGRSHTREHGLPDPAFLDWNHVRVPDAGAVDAHLSQHPAGQFAHCRGPAATDLCNRKGVPWGISESAYAKSDEAGNYQYQAFGLPEFRCAGEPNPLVISPYSTFLGLHVDPSGALRNLRRMEGEGWLGPYGFYESADYTSTGRRSWRHRHELVRCWMAHHQGMSLLALANFLHDGVVQRWFHGDRRVQATELLLHEKPATNVRREFDGAAA